MDDYETRCLNAFDREQEQLLRCLMQESMTGVAEFVKMETERE